MEWNRIQIPEICGEECQFFSQGQDLLGSCALYQTHWTFEEHSGDHDAWTNDCEVLNKPAFCTASEVVYK